MENQRSLRLVTIGLGSFVLIVTISDVVQRIFLNKISAGIRLLDPAYLQLLPFVWVDWLLSSAMNPAGFVNDPMNWLHVVLYLASLVLSGVVAHRTHRSVLDFLVLAIALPYVALPVLAFTRASYPRSKSQLGESLRAIVSDKSHVKASTTKTLEIIAVVLSVLMLARMILSIAMSALNVPGAMNRLPRILASYWTAGLQFVFMQLQHAQSFPAVVQVFQRSAYAMLFTYLGAVLVTVSLAGIKNFARLDLFVIAIWFPWVTALYTALRKARQERPKGILSSVFQAIASSSGSTLSSTQKTCGKCGKVVPNTAKAGQRCPHCGVYWSFENELKRK